MQEVKKAMREMSEVSVEKAFDVVADLKDKIERNPVSAQIFYGLHPSLGQVYVIIQAFGGALILPFANHAL